MPEREYEFELDDEAQDWLRVRIATAGKEVIGFTIQYETTIDERRVAVTRYDSQHGQAHQDILGRRGEVLQKRWLGDITFKQAIQIGYDDLRTNWRRYRSTFIGEAR